MFRTNKLFSESTLLPWFLSLFLCCTFIADAVMLIVAWLLCNFDTSFTIYSFSWSCIYLLLHRQLTFPFSRFFPNWGRNYVRTSISFPFQSGLANIHTLNALMAAISTVDLHLCRIMLSKLITCFNSSYGFIVWQYIFSLIVFISSSKRHQNIDLIGILLFYFFFGHIWYQTTIVSECNHRNLYRFIWH